jgi:predicted  nucleic acid-binding Zn-ribbon protein
MLPELSLASRLQALDERIAALDKEIATLPKIVAALERQLDMHARRLQADQAQLDANAKLRKNLESDIQAHQQKIAKLKDQTMLAKTNEQLHAFQKEIAHFETQVRLAEDQILDLMTAAEPLEAAVQKAAADLAAEKKQVAQQQARARARTEADQKELAQVKADRAALYAELPRTLQQMYDRIKKKTGSSVLAEAVNSRCSACQMAIRPQLFQDIRGGQSILTCEDCGRILYFNPPIAVTEPSV